MRAPILAWRCSESLGLLAALVSIGLLNDAQAQQASAAEEPHAKSEGPSLLEKLHNALSPPVKRKPAGEDDPVAHALYDQMIETMRQAKSLSYVSHYTLGWERHGRSFSQDCTYQVWLKKPNYFRVETQQKSGKQGGILVGDGKNLWIYWPQGRPLQYEDRSAKVKAAPEKEGVKAASQAADAAESKPAAAATADSGTFLEGMSKLVKALGQLLTNEPAAGTCLTSYMTKRTPLGRHSIGHEVLYLGAGMSMPIIDPSTFHGYTDALQAYLDGVKSLGTEKLGEEEFDKIEVSIMKHQRSWYLWLSKQDHLPRKLEQIVRVSFDLVVREEWSSVTLDAEMPDTLFAWKPPEGWTEWKEPEPEQRLLKPGAKAPDFELASADGTPIKLADYRGKVVWLYIWRAG
jgi:outer membrane lipoprotein-sorting protein